MNVISEFKSRVIEAEDVSIFFSILYRDRITLNMNMSF